MGCNKGKHGAITPPNISTALDILKMCVEMLSVFMGIFNIVCEFKLKMTLVLSTSKAQLLLMLLFDHKLKSCWCLHIDLTLQNTRILISVTER